MTTNGTSARRTDGYLWWILLVTVVVAAAAWALSRAESAGYQAEATVVAAPRLRADLNPVPVDPGTERAIARSAAVLRPAAVTLGIGQDELADGLRVDAVPDGAALTITYRDSDRATAQRRAQTVAESYVTYRNQGTAQHGTAASLLTPAGDARRVHRPLRLVLPVGAAVGLLLGLALALLLRSRTRDRVRGRAHFENLTGLPVLATIPRARRSRGPGATLPVLLRSPDSADAESYRYLRARLDPLLRGPSTVLVTSARDAEGRSTTAANLAVALAQAGRSVVLIDADVRSPAQHLIFDAPREYGLTGVLTGETPGSQALRSGPVPGLHVLPAGPDRPGAGDLLVGTVLAEIIQELKDQCDVIILDTAPVLSVADAVALTALSDYVLLVSDHRVATQGAVTRAAAELTQSGTTRVGAVLIGVPEQEGGLVPRTRTGRAPAVVTGSAAAIPPGDRFATLDGPGEPGDGTEPPHRGDSSEPDHPGAGPADAGDSAEPADAGNAAGRSGHPGGVAAGRSPAQHSGGAAAGHAAAQQPDAVAARNGAEHRSAAAGAVDGAEHRPSAAAAGNGAEHRPSATAASNGAEHRPGAVAAGNRGHSEAPPGDPADQRAAAQGRPGQADAVASQVPAAGRSGEADPRNEAAAHSGAAEPSPASAPPAASAFPPPRITAKAAVPRPRVYTSAAKAEAEAREQAQSAAANKPADRTGMARTSKPPVSGAPVSSSPASGASVRDAPAGGSPTSGPPTSGAPVSGSPTSKSPRSGKSAGGTAQGGAPSGGSAQSGAARGGATNGGASSSSASSSSPGGSESPSHGSSANGSAEKGNNAAASTPVVPGSDS